MAKAGITSLRKLKAEAKALGLDKSAIVQAEITRYSVLISEREQAKKELDDFLTENGSTSVMKEYVKGKPMPIAHPNRAVIRDIDTELSRCAAGLMRFYKDHGKPVAEEDDELADFRT